MKSSCVMAAHVALWVCIISSFFILGQSHPCKLLREPLIISVITLLLMMQKTVSSTLRRAVCITWLGQKKLIVVLGTIQFLTLGFYCMFHTGHPEAQPEANMLHPPFDEERPRQQPGVLPLKYWQSLHERVSECLSGLGGCTVFYKLSLSVI